MSKRRGFDIDFPAGTEAPAEEEFPRGPEGYYTGGGRAKPGASRRGPMAAAISENAEALRDRAEAERAIREENDRLAHDYVRLKRAGLITDLVPIDAVLTTKLTRDRAAGPDPEIEELKASIREVGLSNPIRVEPVDDHYELVQGFRRLSAYRELYAETGGEALVGLYRKMVDENLVRRGISFAEMAQLALSFARDPNTETTDIEEAITLLYASAGRQKRSYIRHFATLLEELGDDLHHAEAIPRKLGLDLVKRMGDEEGFTDGLREMLSGQGEVSSDYEVARLADALKSAPKAGPKPKGSSANAAAKTTLRCTGPAGTVRCAARDGKIELAMERDFSSIDRHRLEAAVAAFMAALDD